MKSIDARGLACPAPVLQTKAAVEKEGAAQISVLVDNPAAQQNVKRFLESKGYETRLERRDADYLIVGAGKVQGAPHPEPVAEPTQAAKKILVLCATDRIGFGDDELGLKLMVNFIKTLKEMGPDLWRLVFVNNGVKLTVSGSAVLEELRAHEEKGLQILVCGTCLDYFKLLEHKQVGQTTNMLDIVTAMQLADSVITL